MWHQVALVKLGQSRTGIMLISKPNDTWPMMYIHISISRQDILDTRGSWSRLGPSKGHPGRQVISSFRYRHQRNASRR